MPTPLSILYTQDIRGDLDLLPRLHTFLRQLRQQALRFEDEADVLVCQVQPPDRRVLLVDVGGSCAADVWHCAATGGRSTLFVLDAMGYDAAGVTGQLDAEAREKLAATAQLALVDGEHPFQKDGLLVTTDAPGNPAPGPGELAFVLSPQATATLKGRALYPARLQARQVGVAHVSFSTGAPRLSGHDIFDMPPTMRPDPTIAGAVDFVLGEARYYQQKQAR